MQIIKTSNLGEIKLSFTDSIPSYIYLRDIGLDFALGTKEQILGVDAAWSKHGVYLLLSNINNNEFEYYVGKSSNLLERLKSHNKNKLFWDKVIMVKSSVGAGFTTTEISYLESELILTLKNWQNSKTDNKSEPKDDSITKIQKEAMEYVLHSIINVLSFTGYSELIFNDVINNKDIKNVKNQNYWVVRAGEGGKMIHDFIDKKYIAVDFKDTAPSSIADISLEDLKQNQQSGNAASQLIRFRDQIKIGDFVLSPYKNNFKYAVFEVKSNYKFDNISINFNHQRDAKFICEISREEIDDKMLRSLRTMLTVFQPSGTTTIDKIISENMKK